MIRSAYRALLPPALRRRARQLRLDAMRRQADSLGYEMIESGFYSVLPHVDELPPETWTRRSPLEGIGFDSGHQAAFLRDELSRFVSEFDPTFETGTSLGSFDIRNGAYDEVDSELLYAMVRRFRPRRVVELGSGFSTLVLAHALRANAADGGESVYRVFDPYARPWIQEGVPGVTAVGAVQGQDVPMEEFDALEADDILFVDTTHTVKVGSEVNRIVLDILPRLKPGVLVQFHDIFLPWEYHRHWIEGPWKWNEQYLLQAFLSMNRGYEVLLSAQALVRDRRDDVAELIPTLRDASAPSALWIRSVEER
jgi:hypothetical protein